MDTLARLKDSTLGKKTAYVDTYDKSLLFSIARKLNRVSLNLLSSLPFQGVDIWNAYEISWLNPQGKPIVAIGRIEIPADSPNLIESKSFKLYLNSFNNCIFSSLLQVKNIMIEDISKVAGKKIKLTLLPLDKFTRSPFKQLEGICLDTLDITCSDKAPNINHLSIIQANEVIDETLSSHLLKSNCPVTGQPDWASIRIHYHGYPIDRSGLLKYIISYRHHEQFHEHCVEQIFMDILNTLKPEKLEVYSAFTRRGGLDINPFRTTETSFELPVKRLIRQ